MAVGHEPIRLTPDAAIQLLNLLEEYEMVLHRMSEDESNLAAEVLCPVYAFWSDRIFEQNLRNETENILPKSASKTSDAQA